MRFILSDNCIVCLDAPLRICGESDELTLNVMGDICDFLNDKYVDKSINEEWTLDREARIKYHKEQIELLQKDYFIFREHGDGVR